MLAARQTDRFDVRPENDCTGHLDESNVVGRLGDVEKWVHKHPENTDFLRRIRAGHFLVHAEDSDLYAEVLVVAVLVVLVDAVSGCDEELLIQNGRAAPQAIRRADDCLN